MPAWRPIVAIAERACESVGAHLSWKTKYDDLSLMTVGPAPHELHELLDNLEQVANAIDPQTGALRRLT